MPYDLTRIVTARERRREGSHGLVRGAHSEARLRSVYPRGLGHWSGMTPDGSELNGGCMPVTARLRAY